MRLLILLIVSTFLSLGLIAQQNVGIGTPNPHPSSLLDLTATDKGVLVPRVTTQQRLAIVTPADGLLVYDISFQCFYFFGTNTWNSLCQTGGGSGVTGSTGAIGSQGIQGVTGATGTPGIQGNTGLAGATGLDGSAAAAGSTGATGQNGLNGATGAAGTNGINGINGTNGLTGDTGATGAAGVNGTNGINGLNGAVGDTGAAGVNGTNGTNGINGATGVNGINGTNGTNGINGTNGATGTTGAAGVNGTNGIIGATGATGATGAAGINGTNGTNGATGNNGANGAAGTNGSNGINGVNGATGTNGTNGTNGLNGATGAIGATGTTGITGPTGPGTVCPAALTNYVVKFTAPTDLCNSIIYDNGTRVGIGTTTMNTLVDFVGGASGIITNLLTLRSNFVADNTGTGLRFINSTNTASNVGAEIVGLTTNSTNGRSELLFNVHGGGGGNGALLERVRIQGDGNVGIGYNAPLERLSVNGNMQLDGALRGTVRYYTSRNTASGTITANNTDYLSLPGVTPGTTAGVYIVTFSWCGTDRIAIGTDVMSVDYSGDATTGNTLLTDQSFPKAHLTNNQTVCNTYVTQVNIPANQTWTFKIKIQGGTFRTELFNGFISAIRVN